MKKFYFGSLLVSIIAMAWGCNNDEGFGGDIMPSSDKASMKVVDTFEVKAYTELQDTTCVNNAAYLIAGELSDPIFGKTSASFAARFSISSNSKFPSGAVCDSIVLRLGLDTLRSCFYGDSLSAMMIDVYRFKDSLDSRKSYYHDFDPTPYIEQVPVGNGVFTPCKADTMVSFPLNKDFGDLVIKTSADSTYDKDVWGLYIKPSGTENNCLARFLYNSKYTDMVVYHHAEGSDEVKAVIFTIKSTDLRLPMFSHDYSGTVVEKQVGSESQSDYLYLQSMMGTRIRLEFPDIAKLNKLDSKYVVINDAFLYCPIADSAAGMENLYPSLSALSCIGVRPDNNVMSFFEFAPIYTNGYTSESYLSEMVKDYKNHLYKLNLTYRVKDFLKSYANGKTPEYSVCLLPAGNLLNFQRTVLNSPSNPDKPMKLVVEYMTFEQ